MISLADLNKFDPAELKNIVSPASYENMLNSIPKNTVSSFSSVISSDKLGMLKTSAGDVIGNVVPQGVNLQSSVSTIRNSTDNQKSTLISNTEVKEEKDASALFSEYNTSTLSYPATLLGTDRYPHFVIFYFNVNSKSKLAQDSNNVKEIDTRRSAQQGVSGNNMARPESSYEPKVINANDSVVDKITKGVQNTTGETLDAVKKTFSSSRKRLKKAIALYMPKDLNFSHNAAYNDYNLPPLVGAVMDDLFAGQYKEAGVTAGKAMVQNSMGAAVTTVGGIASAITRDSSISNASQDMSRVLRNMSGLAFNNRREQMFEEIGFREYQFTYVMIPRNQPEADNIANIVKEFKYHMHPSLPTDGNKSFLVLPAEVDIEFRYKDKENENISKIATCVITNFSVNYTPLGQFIAYDGTGIPQATVITLTLKETEPMVADMVERGF
jgi:hypothetical protein